MPDVAQGEIGYGSISPRPHEDPLDQGRAFLGTGMGRYMLSDKGFSDGFEIIGAFLSQILACSLSRGPLAGDLDLRIYAPLDQRHPPPGLFPSLFQGHFADFGDRAAGENPRI